MIRIAALIFTLLSIVINVLIMMAFDGHVISETPLLRFFAPFSILAFLGLHILVVALYRSPFCLISLFNLFNWLFLYGRVILYVLGFEGQLFEFFTFHQESLSEGYIIQVILAANLATSAIHLAVFIFSRPDLQGMQLLKAPVKDSYNLQKVLFYFTIVSAVLFGIKGVIEVKHIQKIGYTALYIGGLGELNYYSPIIKYSHYLFFSGFAFLLTTRLAKRNYILLAILFVILTFIDGLKGARILFILPLFYVLWFYFRYYAQNANYVKVTLVPIFILLGVVVFSEVLKHRRSEANSAVQLSIADIPRDILLETGKTLQIAAVYLNYKDDINPPGDVFALEPIVYPYYYLTQFDAMTGGQSEELVRVRNSLNHQLTYYINPNYYLVGGGLGSTFVAELLQLGYGWLFAISFLMGYLIMLYEKNLHIPILIFLSPGLIQHILFVSRESPFPNLIGVFKNIVIFIVILLAIEAYKFIIDMLRQKTAVSQIESSNTPTGSD